MADIELINQEKFNRALYVAALETIRTNRFNPLLIGFEKSDEINTTAETYKSRAVPPKTIWVITGITALDVDDAAVVIQIGIDRNNSFYIFESATTSTANNSVEYVGELLLQEGDRVRVDVRDASEGDTIKVAINGFKIRY